MTPRDVMQQALDALEWVNDNTADEMPIVDAALFDLRCELDKPEEKAVRDLEEAEQYIQNSIDCAPEPLKRLGKWLTNVLDETQWPHAERLLLGAIAAKPAAVPDGWRTFPDEVPPPDTECLVEVPFRDGTFRAVDTWEMQSECPVSWSSATVETGYGWSNYCDDEPLRWIPIAHLTAARPQPPAVAVDVEAVRSLTQACIALKADLLERAETDASGTKVVACGASVWIRFNRALARAIGDKTND